MESLRQTTRKCCGVRHLVALLTFIGTVCMSVMRVNLSVTISAMAKSLDSGSDSQVPRSSACGNSSMFLAPFPGNETTQTLGVFDWDLKTQSFVISSFFYGYTAGELLTSVMVQRFGVRRFSGFSMFTCSLLAILTPFSAHWGAGYLMAVRAIQGISQGVVISTINMVVSEWIPMAERSRAFAFISSGISVGSMLGMFVSGLLVESSAGWPSAFYVAGGSGILWYISWLAVVHDSPSEHPFISDDEKEFILTNQDNKEIKKSSHIPWRAILMSAPFWAYCSVTVALLIGMFITMIEIPIYLFNALHFDVKTSGGLSAIPFILRILFINLSGYAADVMRKSGSFGGGLLMLAVAFVGCRASVIVGLLCAYAALASLIFSGAFVTSVDMSPRFSATLGGICFTIGNFCGAVFPSMVAEITKTGQTVENWSWVFIIMASIHFATGIMFVWLGNATLQPWDSYGQKKQEKAVQRDSHKLQAVGRTNTDADDI